jgi:hypothetical protein
LPRSIQISEQLLTAVWHFLELAFWICFLELALWNLLSCHFLLPLSALVLSYNQQALSIRRGTPSTGSTAKPNTPQANSPAAGNVLSSILTPRSDSNVTRRRTHNRNGSTLSTTLSTLSLSTRTPISPSQEAEDTENVTNISNSNLQTTAGNLKVFGSVKGMKEKTAGQEQEQQQEQQQQEQEQEQQEQEQQEQEQQEKRGDELSLNTSDLMAGRVDWATRYRCVYRGV